MLPKNDLFNILVNRIRIACEKQDIKNGAIGVCFLPVPGLVTEWMEALNFSICETHFAPISLFGNTAYREGDNECDGLAVVSAEIMGAKRVMQYYEDNFCTPSREQCTSGSLQNEMTGIGVSNRKGAVAIDIGVRTGIGCYYRGTKALTIFIGVAGGTPEQDEAAAWTGLDVIKAATKDDPDVILARTYYED